jgi:hypothetical protein
VIALVASILLVSQSGCTQKENDRAKRRLDEAGQELKHDTRKATEKLKQGAREASQELQRDTHNAEREIKKSSEELKRHDQSR